MRESTTADALARGVTGNEPLCPVCGAESSVSEEAPGWSEWRVCGRCQLAFVNPRPTLNLASAAAIGRRGRCIRETERRALS